MMGLRHPNVVLMLGIATDHVRRVGIVLERLEISLLELLHGAGEYKEYRTWRASLLSIASDVAKGIAYLHFNNVLHRDLKPGNVLLSDTWVAKVADFGSSANAKTSAAGDEAIHGTPPYMAPEVARGESNQTAALDVWSFGCLLVHMGTLRPPYYALKCKRALDIVRVVQRGDVSPVQVLLDDSERREYRCPASIVVLAKQCCHREPTERPDIAAIAGALASPTIQTGIYKGAKETRPLVRLQRSRASVEGEGTFDASKATYDASVAPSARGGAEESPRSSPAHNASKSKFQNLSKHAPAGTLSTRGEPAPSVRSASETNPGTFDGMAEKSVESTSNRTFNRTFDGKAEASTATANKTSIGLTANLARASISNLNAGNKSQRDQGMQRAEGSSARSSSTAGAAMSPVGGGGGGAVRPSAPSAASASAAAPPSTAPKSAATPLGSPAAERTMAQKVARIKEELSLNPSLPVAKAVAEANAAMGIEGQGTLAQQVDLLLTELGVLC
jgi:protein kinase 1